MKKYLQFSFILFLIILSISIFFSCGTKTVEGDIAFIHVNVIPMDKEQILLDQTVVLKDGLIIDLGLSSSINVSSNTTQIDASGQYLIPALSDMHVHIELEKNPLEDISNIRSIAGVILKGHFISKKEIQNKLKILADSYIY